MISLLALDRDEEAKNAFRRMAALSPGDADQLFILQKGYSRLTSALLERMTEMAPDSARVHQMRAELLDADHQPDRALEEYKQAVSKEPNVAALHYALGCAYWARFRAADAVPEFESAIRIDSSHYMAHYKLGLALAELDRVPDAIQQLKRTLELQPGLANAHLGLAKAYSHTGDSESALASAGECLKLDPNNESALYLRAQMFHKLGREHEANEQLSNLRAIRERAKENHATVKVLRTRTGPAALYPIGDCWNTVWEGMSVLHREASRTMMTSFRMRAKQADRKVRETRLFVKAMQSATHPILAQVVPIRRCNLDCSYCNEYDKTSSPVPLEINCVASTCSRVWAQRSSRLAEASQHYTQIWTRSSGGFASAVSMATLSRTVIS